jgi:environmental stress-induced protein Ves
VKLVEAGALPPTPWRNGGGVTRAIAAEPEDASFDDCLWRVDLSDIGRAGPFSHLAGLDRTLVPLTRGLVLTVDGLSHELDPFRPFAFCGDSDTTCELASPMQAFNALTRRKRANAIVECWESAGRITGPGALIIYVVRGEFGVVEGAGRLQHLGAGAAMVTRTLGVPVAFGPSKPQSLAISVVVRLAQTS